MQHSPDSTRAALLLTNKLVPLDAQPLTAREFWRLVEHTDPGDLVQRDATGIAELAGVSDDEATRLRALLDAATAFGFEAERLHDGGISVISALDDRFPAALRERLGPGCPPFLLVAGPVESLARTGLGIVGSRSADDEALSTAGDAARLAVQHDWPVVSGLAQGVDRAAMSAAIDAGGTVTGVPAEGILKASRSAEVRRWVHEGTLCLASPYGPNVPFRAGHAMGRNRIVDALSRIAFVVAVGEKSGSTWAGAQDALDRRYVPVAVWAGAGAPLGNHALVERGARPITDLGLLFAMETSLPPPPRQNSLF